ncbi:MAG: 6-phosphofructokinase [Saccharofermentanales bacterium]|jgi:6-phosphofructokinase 1|nr:6-phosphofructokinase [Clostridiaceae bacterium]
MSQQNATNSQSIRNIGVLTSGGDAPGMNAVIRAVVRGGIFHGFQVFGIERGFHGMWRGNIVELNSRSVSEKLQRGGTFLMTARSKTFNTPEGVDKAIAMAKVFNLDAVVVIGGDGTFRGARDLAAKGFPVIAVPGTIDNDIACTEYTIGYDTAMNTAMQAIDRLRDTASSHERCSVIEVMGRNAGYLALNVAVATGAEVVMIPEAETNIQSDVIKVLLEGRNRGKKHFIVVVAEGTGNTMEIAETIERVAGIEARATILGHLQRGGSPTLRDRQMGSIMGLQAVECLRQGRVNRVIAYQQGNIIDLDIEEALSMTKTINAKDLERANILAL